MREIIDDIARQNLRDVRVKDAFISAICPFHKGGQEKSPSFWVRRDDGGWGCFTCHCGGRDIQSLLTALGTGGAAYTKQLKEVEKELRSQAKINKVLQDASRLRDFKALYPLPEALLGVYDWEPTDLVEAGFDAELLKAEDIGYDRARERITFPVRDIYGTLCGISGRQPEGLTPKYKFYTGWHVFNGKRLPGELGEDFPSYNADDVRNHLWGGHFIFDDLFNNRFDQLIVVEGYKARLWLKQCGWTYVVAAMGSALSRQQVRCIQTMGPETWVLFDNNTPGRDGSIKACEQLAAEGVTVYEVSYPEEAPEWVQPDDMDPSDLESMFMKAKRVLRRSGGKHARRMARQQAS